MKRASSGAGPSEEVRHQADSGFALAGRRDGVEGAGDVSHGQGSTTPLGAREQLARRIAEIRVAQVGGPNPLLVRAARARQRRALLHPAHPELGRGIRQRATGEERAGGAQILWREPAQVFREQVALRVLAAGGADRRGHGGEIGEGAGR